MAGNSIKLTGFDEVLRKLDVSKFEEDITDELAAFGADVARDAKQLAPVDEGFLRNSIGFDAKTLSVEIFANCDYAAYLEFGTRKFAARYVATLPQDWQTFAAQYKGPSGSGDIWEFLLRLTQWVHRKGIAGTYSTKTQKRTGAKAGRFNEDFDAAFGIALYILRNGIRPHPFMFPAVEKNRPKLLERLKNLLNA